MHGRPDSDPDEASPGSSDALPRAPRYCGGSAQNLYTTAARRFPLD